MQKKKKELTLCKAFVLALVFHLNLVEKTLKGK